ncbi:MAG: arginine--tRNA ligase [Candidatus Eisenbacteria bacterium]|uniref:Arginine--tRNA ligase n=1 Tax=Eiseniibacteriota bacterium TaxID=2212470 RepID=A0A956LYC3_UNCEI|nr:arginine--tRNA ligase [Candidatus Eisenbacteria bacterium]
MSRFDRYRDELLSSVLALAPVPVETRPEGLTFSRPPRPEMGDLALPAFPLAKIAGRPPKEIADQWAEALRTAVAERNGVLVSTPGIPAIAIEQVTTAGPYVNFTLDGAAVTRSVLEDIVTAGGCYGSAENPTESRVMVEYSSPNTNKPLHLGHVRNNLIGISLCSILEAAGDTVIRTTLVNDRGIHICKSMLAYQRWGNGETPTATGEKGDHLVGRYYVLYDQKVKEERRQFAESHGVDLSRFSSEARKGKAKDELAALDKEAEQFEASFEAASELTAATQKMLLDWEAGEPETLALWRTMNEWVLSGFRETYDRMGARFDRWYFESETYKLGKDEVDRGLRMGVFEKRADGAVWAKLEQKGLQDKVLLRSDGTSVYITQDLGTAVRKHEDYGMDRSIYVVGSEQIAHFKNLFAMLELLGHPWAGGCYHASYGLVTLPRGMGKLKSREGKAVDADDLFDELHQLAEAKIVEGGYCESPEDVSRVAEMIGQGAVKMYLLQVSSDKNIQFDPNETIAFAGDTGPAVQYSHARIQGILRKGLDQGLIREDELALRTTGSAADPLVPESGESQGRRDGGAWIRFGEHLPAGPFLSPRTVDAAVLHEPEERDVLRLLADYPHWVRVAAGQLSAAPVANYLLDLTKAYARMYHQHEVLRASDPALMRARLQLALCVAQVLRNGLALLSIEAPDRM